MGTQNPDAADLWILKQVNGTLSSIQSVDGQRSLDLDENGAYIKNNRLSFINSNGANGEIKFLTSKQTNKQFVVNSQGELAAGNGLFRMEGAWNFECRDEKNHDCKIQNKKKKKKKKKVFPKKKKKKKKK